jgi:hypothetical protein
VTETVEWSVTDYLRAPERRCPVCTLRLLIGERVDVNEHGDAAHFRCRIGDLDAVEATEEIFDRVMRAAELAAERRGSARRGLAGGTDS